MKTWNAIGILTILVSGMVLMSGCISSGSTTTVTAAPTLPQIVNEPGLVTQTPAPEITVPAPTVPETTVTSVALTVTTTATPQQPAPGVPPTGVWVKITYTGNFSGSVGTPGVLKVVEDRGDHLYQISTSDGPVVVTIQKSDGTSAELAVDVYKDGTLWKHDATTSPRGIIEIQKSLRIVTIAPTAVPTQKTSGLNESADTTPALTLSDQNPGSLIIRTGGLGGSPTVYIARDGSSVAPIESIYDPYRNILQDQALGYIAITILPDGNSDCISLIPGRYTAYLPDKNGYQPPEKQSFTIEPDSMTTVTFAGYSYRASSSGGCGGT